MSDNGAESFFSGEDPHGRAASEFGGVGGLIQPPPHDPLADASEANSLLMAQDRDDIVEAIEAMKPRGV